MGQGADRGAGSAALRRTESAGLTEEKGMEAVRWRDTEGSAGAGLVFLSEPTANIDPATTAEIEQMLIKINENFRTTIVLITHNLAQARRVCERCLFLKDGLLVEEGDAQQMLRMPQNPVTRRFIEGELLI